MKNINFWNTEIDKNTYQNQKKVFLANFPNEGKFTNKFEKKISKLLNAKYCIATPNCTLSLYMVLKYLNLKKTDEVIVPNLTFPATANAVVMAGAKVVLCDINKNTLNIDTKDLKNKISSKTKAVIPVHVSGRACDFKEIKKICKKKKLFILEDAAEAFYSKYNNNFLGVIGDAGCFSLSPNKIFTSGQGGLIVTNNKKLFLFLKMFKNQGRYGAVTGGDDFYHINGGNFKFPNILSGIAMDELRHLKRRRKQLIKIYKFYHKNFKGNKNIKILPFKVDKGEFPLWVDAICKKRNDLVNYLESKNIFCRKFWKPLNKLKSFKSFNRKRFKNSDLLSDSLLWLPSAFNLTNSDLKIIVREIHNFYNKK